jgi:prepilin-type N-terminal cleavage/methylation domain-containing protein
MRSDRRRDHAFTLPEIMIVMAIFSMLIAALISSQLFGLRMYRITETKLATTDGTRKVLSRIRNEVLSSTILVVGNGNDINFTPIANNQLQVGNALKICATTDTNVFVRYFLNTNDTTLERVTSLNVNPEILARGITNSAGFQSEDFRGNILTNNQNARVVRMILEFRKFEYAAANGGQKGLYDYYRLQTRITRRITE